MLSCLDAKRHPAFGLHCWVLLTCGENREPQVGPRWDRCSRPKLDVHLADTQPGVRNKCLLLYTTEIWFLAMQQKLTI